MKSYQNHRSNIKHKLKKNLEDRTDEKDCRADLWLLDRGKMWTLPTPAAGDNTFQ